MRFSVSSNISLSIPARGVWSGLLKLHSSFYIPDNSEVFPSILPIHYSYITAEEISSNFRPSQKTRLNVFEFQTRITQDFNSIGYVLVNSCLPFPSE